MSSQYHSVIQQLYVAYFNRPADVDGLDYWENALQQSKGNLDQVSSAFAGSVEYRDAYGSATVAERVNRVYLNLFGREAEAQGLSYWTGLLEQKLITVADLVKQVAAGAQLSDKTAFTNKVLAANAFTAALDTRDEAIAYSSGPPAVAVAAKHFLQTITTDASLTAALKPEALAATVDYVTKLSVMFTLTAGVDRLSGTEGDDHYAAPAVDGKSTLQDGDRIQAGAGTADRLDATIESTSNTRVSPVTTDLEIVAVRAAAVGMGLSQDPPPRTVTLNATGMQGVAHWESVGSTASLDINNVSLAAGLRTSDARIVLRESSVMSHLHLTLAAESLRPGSATAGHDLVTASVVLDDVGLGFMGGGLVVGASAGGIGRYEVEVQDSSQLRYLGTTGNTLREVVIKNGTASSEAAVADKGHFSLLGLGGVLMPDASVPSQALLEMGLDPVLTDLRLIDASAMTGKFAFAARLTAAAIDKYLKPAVPPVQAPTEFAYSGGANDDTMLINIDGLVMAGTNPALSRAPELRFTASGGAGNDLIMLDIGGSHQSIWYTGQKVYGEIVIAAGAGNDTVRVSGGGDLRVELGFGDDSFEATGNGYSDSRIRGDLGNDTIVLANVNGLEAATSSNDTIVYGAGMFGADKIVGFSATGVGADRLDFVGLGGRGADFAATAVSTADKAITVQAETQLNAHANYIAAMYADVAVDCTRVFVTYDTANVGKVYSVVDTVAGAPVVTLVGTIDLGPGTWSALTAASFV